MSFWTPRKVLSQFMAGMPFVFYLQTFTLDSVFYCDDRVNELDRAHSLNNWFYCRKSFIHHIISAILIFSHSFRLFKECMQSFMEFKNLFVWDVNIPINIINVCTQNLFTRWSVWVTLYVYWMLWWLGLFIASIFGFIHHYDLWTYYIK